MRQGSSVLGSLSCRSGALAGMLAVSLAALEVFFDWTTPIDVNVSIVYGLPLVLAAAARSRVLLWSLALILVLTIFAVYSAQTPPGIFSLRERFFIDRELSAITLLLMAGFLHARTLTVDALHEQRRSLDAHNVQLERANRELSWREETITRQNEELDRRRREAEEGSDRKTRLLASASHDIRSPVSAICLMAEVIRRSSDDPALAAQIPSLAQRLQANARSLANLVSHVLDASSFASGRISLHERKLSLNALLAEECGRLLPLAEAKGLHLAAELAEPAIWLRADKVTLARIVDNLLGNAIKFTETGGVTVTAELITEQAVLIRVRDTGIGIAPENLARIFDEYAQISNQGRDRTRGWGLGLAICRRLVEDIGGNITVESHLNRGSVFSVQLPASRVVDRPGQPCGEPPAGKNGPRPEETEASD
jgi:signal transduction histidine kinase